MPHQHKTVDVVRYYYIPSVKFLYVLGLPIFLLSCSHNIEQEYNDYAEFSKATLRGISWFPDLIAKDCYHFREVHNLDNNNSLGSFPIPMLQEWTLYFS